MYGTCPPARPRVLISLRSVIASSRHSRSSANAACFTPVIVRNASIATVIDGAPLRAGNPGTRPGHRGRRGHRRRRLATWRCARSRVGVDDLLIQPVDVRSPGCRLGDHPKVAHTRFDGCEGIFVGAERSHLVDHADSAWAATTCRRSHSARARARTSLPSSVGMSVMASRTVKTDGPRPRRCAVRSSVRGRRGASRASGAQ